LAVTLRKRGLKAIAIHGGNGFFKATQNGPQILENFLQNKADYDVVINVDILGIGVSAPELGLVINISPTYSKVRAVQRVRNNRLSWNNPDKRPITVEFNYVNSKREKQGSSPQVFYSDILNGEEIFIGSTSPYESIQEKFVSARKILTTTNQVQIIGVDKIIADRAQMSRERWTLDRISDAILNWNIEHQDHEIIDPDTYVLHQEQARLPILNRLVHLCKNTKISIAGYFGLASMTQKPREYKKFDEWTKSSPEEMLAWWEIAKEDPIFREQKTFGRNEKWDALVEQYGNGPKYNQIQNVFRKETQSPMSAFFGTAKRRAEWSVSSPEEMLAWWKIAKKDPIFKGLKGFGDPELWNALVKRYGNGPTYSQIQKVIRKDNQSPVSVFFGKVPTKRTTATTVFLSLTCSKLLKNPNH
jgi:hypothetical protein